MNHYGCEPKRYWDKERRATARLLAAVSMLHVAALLAGLMLWAVVQAVSSLPGAY